jgi:diguanylate cyclase (GGDEF)-like protein
MQMIWLLLAAQLGLYTLAWLVASVCVRTHQVSTRFWGESSGCFVLGLIVIASVPDEIKDHPSIYALCTLLLTQGFLLMSSGTASFFSVRHWSRDRVLAVSAATAIVSWLMASYVMLDTLRLSFPLLLYGSIILIVITRFHAAEVAEFGRWGTWVLQGPALLLSLGMIARGIMGSVSSNEVPPELESLSTGNYALALGAMFAAGALNLTYAVRLGMRLVHRLTELSHSDPLTGLTNRRGLDEAIGDEYRRYVRSGRPYALISIDIDHFKTLNHRFGHSAGDQVLVSLAQLMADQAQSTDTAARIGGEEFLLLLTDTDPAKALATAERLRQRAASLQILWGKDSMSVTISLGVANSSLTSETVASLMERADSALFQAKAAGRNCVVVADSASPVVSRNTSD